MMENQFDKKGNSFWYYPCVDEGELEHGINYLMPVMPSVRRIDFVDVLGRCAAHTGLEEHKVLLKGLLSEAKKGRDGENYENRVIKAFKLFNPRAFD